jgi:hypothetical protein
MSGETKLSVAVDAAHRIEQLERELSQLRHFIRGALSPAVLMADAVSTYADPKVARAAATVISAVDRVVLRLRETHAVLPPLE